MTYKEVLSMVEAGFTKAEIIAMDRMSQQANPSQPTGSQIMNPQFMNQQPMQPQPMQPQPMQPQPMQQQYTHPVNVLDAVQAFNRSNATFDVPPQRTGTDILNEQLCQTATGMSPDDYLKTIGDNSNGN